MPESVSIYGLQRQLSRRIAAVEHGDSPLLITGRKRWVALLVPVELGLQHASPVRPIARVGVTKLASELSSVLQTVRREGKAVVITRRRRPVAMLIPAEGALMDEHVKATQAQLDELLEQLKTAPGPTLGERIQQLRTGAGPKTSPE